MKTDIKSTARVVQMIAKSFLLILFLILLPTTRLSAEDIGMKLAKDRSLPGKNKPGECSAYANALFAKMNAAGVQAYRVSFDWSNLGGSSGMQSGAHAIVVFQDVRGRYYGVDNMTWKPIWLKGKNSQEWASFITGMDTSASVRSSVASRAASPNGKIAIARAE